MAQPVFAHAAELERTLDFINAGTEPVYAIRIGQHAANAWGEDLLGSTNVVDVGEDRRVQVRLTDSCWYDVRYEYRDGSAREIDGVDLCSANRLFLK